MVCRALAWDWVEECVSESCDVYDNFYEWNTCGSRRLVVSFTVLMMVGCGELARFQWTGGFRRIR